MDVRRFENKSFHSLTRPFYFYHEGHEGHEKVIVRHVRKNGADQRSLPLVCACAHIVLIALWSSFPREISTFNIQYPLFRVRQPQRMELCQNHPISFSMRCVLFAVLNREV